MVNESIRKKYWSVIGGSAICYSGWTKEFIISQISRCMQEGRLSLKCKIEELKKMPKKLLKEQCLIAPAHHPGTAYRDSEVCYLNISNIEKLTNDDIKELISCYKKLPPEPEKNKTETWLCSYPVLCASGKRYKSKKVTEIGKIINDTWFICSDGTRKRVNAKEFERIERVDGEGENQVRTKFVYDFPKINIGAGIAGTYILVGGSGVKGDFFLEKMTFCDGHDCNAYVVEGYDIWIDSDFHLVGEYKHWLKIYNDVGLTKEFKADRILVYCYVRGATFCVIQLINEEAGTKLFKNVDICDLESIVENGVLSIDECGNDNWEDGHRADNPTDRVYLFGVVKGRNNTYPDYGVALLEIDAKDAKQNEFAANDVHKDDYIEYTTAKVEPSQITRILIPEIFKEEICLSEAVEKKVEWCGMAAEVYADGGFVTASDEVLKKFAETAYIMDSNSFNFFRGENDNRSMIDLYNINYIF